MSTIRVESNAFYGLLNEVKGFASENKHTPGLCSVQFEFAPTFLRLTATDRYKVLLGRINYEGEEGSGARHVPADTPKAVFPLAEIKAVLATLRAKELHKRGGSRMLEFESNEVGRWDVFTEDGIITALREIPYMDSLPDFTNMFHEPEGDCLRLRLGLFAKSSKNIDVLFDPHQSKRQPLLLVPSKTSQLDITGLIQPVAETISTKDPAITA